MRKFSGGLMTGLLIGAAVAVVLVLALRPAHTWQQGSVREQAKDLGCNMSHGLKHSCIRVSKLTKTGDATWIAQYRVGQPACFELTPTWTPPRRRPCV